MSATSSASPSSSAPGASGRQASQAPRVHNGATGGAKKGGNGHGRADSKGDAGRKSPQASSNGQQAQKKAQPKAKPASGMSEYLRSRGASIETAALVAQIRADLGGYYSEEQVFNTLTTQGNNADATRAALTQSKATSWASKVSPSAAVATPSAPTILPAPAHIAKEQQAPRPRKVNKPAQDKKPASPEPVVAEVAVDPEHLEKSLESALQAHQTQTQELLGLQQKVSTVRGSQAELSAEREQLLAKIAEHEAEIAKDRARIQTIDVTLTEHKNTLASLQKTIAQKTTKQ